MALYSISLLWASVLPKEEDAFSGVVSDEEEEGVVCHEMLLSCHTKVNHYSCGCCCLCAFLIYLHKSFVGYRRHKKASFATHARQIGSTGLEQRAHAHLIQNIFQRVLLFQLEFWQMDDDIGPPVHLFLVCPLKQFVHR